MGVFLIVKKCSKQIMVDWPCGDSGVYTQNNPDSNGISVGCNGHNLDDHCSIVAQSPVNGQVIHSDCMLIDGR